MTGLWQLWEGALAPDWCGRLVWKVLQRVKPDTATVGITEGDKRTQDSVRRSKLRWLDAQDPTWADVRNKLEYYFRWANTQTFGVKLEWLPDVQFTEYNEEDRGHYEWHQDLDWVSNSPSQRKLSIVVQLSNPSMYEGGELLLEKKSPPPEALKAQGSVIVFPSFLQHKVTPVTKGVRYSLVGWYEGPNYS